MKREKFSVRKRFDSFRYAFKGIRSAFSSEHNLWIHLVVSALVIIGGFIAKLNFREWIIVTFAIGFVIAAELFNSAIEILADFVSPGQHNAIGKVKDIAAGAVLIAVISAVITGILIFWPHVKIYLESLS